MLSFGNQFATSVSLSFLFIRGIYLVLFYSSFLAYALLFNMSMLSD